MFFFSSRRRHTRLQGDWSSDVCSSDLADLRLTARDADTAWGQLDKLLLIANLNHSSGTRDVGKSELKFQIDNARTPWGQAKLDRKSTRLNSSHLVISYAVFCLKKKKRKH